MEARVERAIDIFLDAINNGTLAKGTCKACAVGNLVAAGMGAKIFKVNMVRRFGCDMANDAWGEAFATNGFSQSVYEKELNDPMVIQNISATEFTWQELAAIEFAFERTTIINVMSYDDAEPSEIRADQIRGLEAVVKVMLSFSNDKESDVKQVFTDKAELIEIR